MTGDAQPNLKKVLLESGEELAYTWGFARDDPVIEEESFEVEFPRETPLSDTNSLGDAGVNGESDPRDTQLKALAKSVSTHTRSGSSRYVFVHSLVAASQPNLVCTPT